MEVLFILLVLFDVVALVMILSFRYRSKKKQNLINHYGDNAEERVSAYIRKHQPGCILLNDIYLKTEVGLTQLDHILICRHGIFVIETKSNHGHIVIGPRNWVQYYKEKTVKFHSPILQNRIHTKALRNVLLQEKSLSGIPIFGVTVFTSRNVTFSTPVKAVIKLPQLNSLIRRTGMGSQYYKNASKKTKTHPFKGGLYRSTMIKIEKHILNNAVKSRLKQGQHRNKIYNLTHRF